MSAEREHVPIRTCAGCRETGPRSELVRFATVGDPPQVVADPEARLPGRGAWLHPRRECFDVAVARRGFHRAFRTPVTLHPDTVDFTDRWPRNASTS